MNTIKALVVVFLLIFSTQSLALFMPAGEQINTDKVVAFNDVGC